MPQVPRLSPRRRDNAGQIGSTTGSSVDRERHDWSEMTRLIQEQNNEPEGLVRWGMTPGGHERQASWRYYILRG